jgi:hypothetical protein
MADLEKTVAILFKANDEISNTVDKMSGSLSSFNSSVISATAPLASFAAGIEKLDVAMAAIVVGGLALAVNAYGDFEMTMIKVKGVMSASDGDYERLSGLTRQLGLDTQFTAQQSAEGLLVLATAGM